MSGFYKMDPAAWNQGTDNLSLEEEAAYLRIVNAMHIHHGPVHYHDRVLAGLFRCSARKARSLVDALVTAGKLTVEDGLIYNERARKDLVQRGFVSISRAEFGAKGGKRRAENAAKALNGHDTPQANAEALASSREEKRRDTVEPSGSTGAVAPPVEPPKALDPAAVIFRQGLALLMAGGVKEPHGRSQLGRWRKTYGDEALIAALGMAQREGALNPTAFIERCLQQRARASPKHLAVVGGRRGEWTAMGFIPED